MKNIFQSLSVAILLSLFVPFVTSCDDDDEALNEWEATYVSLQRQDYLSGDVKSFDLTHEEVVNGEQAELVFNVKTQQAAPADITVKLAVTADEGFDTNLITLSKSTITLAKGSMISEDIAAIADLTTLGEISEKFRAGFQISIAEISTTDNNTVVSQNQHVLQAQISKAYRYNLQFGLPENSGMLNTNTEWDFEFMDGVENADDNSVAGTGTNDVATDGVPFWVTIDLKKEIDVHGIYTTFWNGNFAPSSVKIYTSDDGSTWDSHGEIEVSGGTQRIAFIDPVKTRYLKYQMLEVPYRVSLTSLLVYTSARLSVSDDFPESWTELDRTDWGVTCAASPYSPEWAIEGILDDSEYSGYFVLLSQSAPIIVDMKENHTIQGISITSNAYSYNANYSLQDVQILTSTDGQAWENYLTVTLKQATDGVTPQYILLDESIDAQYVKVVPISAYNGYFGISELRVYE